MTVTCFQFSLWNFARNSTVSEQNEFQASLEQRNCMELKQLKILNHRLERKVFVLVNNKIQFQVLSEVVVVNFPAVLF